MGLTTATFKLSNPRKPDLLPVEIKALADTGALHLCIPEHIAIQLDLKEAEKREVTLADGSKQKVSYVGPIQMEFMNRKGFNWRNSNGRYGFGRDSKNKNIND